MRTIIDYLAENWSSIAIPVAVFIVALIAVFWLRKWALDRLSLRLKKISWIEGDLWLQSIRGPSSLFCIILSLYLGLAVSRLPADWKNLSVDSLWTLFIIAFTLFLLNAARGLSLHYGRKFNLPRRVVLIIRNVIWTVILLVSVLVVLDLWGVPTSPLILLIAVVVLLAILAFRDALPNLFAGFQIAATGDIKVGDYIKLDTGEEGYVTVISWNDTKLKSLDESTVIIPNVHLVHRKVINYGRPLKKAQQPFYFNTRTHMAELTGLKARSLPELVDILRKAPDEVIYYHTHRFLEEHQYLIPQLSNDFAIWVNDALGNEALSERLANLNLFESGSLGAFRNKAVNIIDEYLYQNNHSVPAMLGREFYFMKSVSVILPTPYVAHDLREFVESLRKISPGSLYFHVFESRLRTGDGANDFSSWLSKEMGETELSREISGIDPYTYTLEGLRSLLVQKIEKHIK